MTISRNEHYKPSLVGSLFDDYIDSVAAGYVIYEDDGPALHYITDNVIDGLSNSDVLPDEYSAVAGRVEWWVRENYQHVDRPSEVERHAPVAP